MRLIYDTKGVSLLAESEDDVKTLVNFSKPVKVAGKKKRRKGYKRVCHCGKECSGNIGIGIHQRKAHGVVAPNSKYPVS